VTSRTRIALFCVALGLCAASAHAGSFGDTGISPGYSPRVPISALARPAAWFDPSRLHLTTSVTVGSGFGGGTNALQTTSLRYDFGAPLWLNVSVGNAWGPGSASRNSIFLQGLDVGYRPFQSLLVRVQYRNVRSPLQNPNGVGTPYGVGQPYWGD
jgi:hypothetical protein